MPVVPRLLANRDVDDALAYLLKEGAERAALGFVDALEEAFAHLGRHPGSGSARYAHELDIPGLRTWPVQGYPYLIFYVERHAHVDVWRVLHTPRDVPPLFRSG